MNTAFYFSFFGSRDAINVIVAFLCAVWQFLYCVFRSYAGLFFPVRFRKTLAIVHKNKDCHFSSRGWRFFRHFVYEVYEQWNGGCRREALNIFLCAHRYSFCAFFAFAGFDVALFCYCVVVLLSQKQCDMHIIFTLVRWAHQIFFAVILFPFFWGGVCLLIELTLRRNEKGWKSESKIKTT